MTVDPFTKFMDKMDDPQIAIITLSKNTHQSSIIFFVGFIFMLLFVIGPFSFKWYNKIGIKVCILIILAIALYNNHIGARHIQDKYAKQLDEDKSWQPVRSHVTYTHVYMLFIALLMICFILF